MKIVCISDTHSSHSWMRHELPEADVLVHAGDLENSGRQLNDVHSYAKWLETQKHKYKKIIQIAGNHDGMFQNDTKGCIEIVKNKVENFVYLENEEFVFEGVKFYGSPITPTFFSWYYMADRGEKIKKYWDAIPADVNFLITHGPPHGTLDLVHYDKIHVGCEELEKRIKDLKKLDVHCFGHIHETRGSTEKEGVTYINPAVCNLNYNPVGKPFVIEYDLETRTVIIRDC